MLRALKLCFIFLKLVEMTSILIRPLIESPVNMILYMHNNYVFNQHYAMLLHAWDVIQETIIHVRPKQLYMYQLMEWFIWSEYQIWQQEMKFQLMKMHVFTSFMLSFLCVYWHNNYRLLNSKITLLKFSPLCNHTVLMQKKYY